MERTSVHCLGYPLTASQTNNSNLFPNFHGAAVYRISWAYSLQQIHNTTDIHNESCIFLFSNFPMDCIQCNMLCDTGQALSPEIQLHTEDAW